LQSALNWHLKNIMIENEYPEIREISERAKNASIDLAYASGELKQKAIQMMHKYLMEYKNKIFQANKLDLKDASNSGMKDHLLKRLKIDEKVFNYMAGRIKEVAELPDPVGKILHGETRPDGLIVQKVSVPLGVIAIIYESRPNVTTDAATVCLKSGNAVILRGGSESLRTNIILTDAMKKAIKESGLPENAVQIIRTPGHGPVNELLRQDKYIDVVIPRGGKNLIKAVAETSRIPVIKHYEGICHMYIAPDADIDTAINLALNSKLQRVEVCNALETLLVDTKIAEEILPVLAGEFSNKNVELRGCKKTLSMIPDKTVPAAEEDWSTEYLAPILSVKVVDSIEDAVKHINTYGSGHTDIIATKSLETARFFVNRVDSASVLVNASTRLSGGGDYGLGAVVGISTDKLHARGPVGPSDLTSYKWVAYGNGHLRK
jgi:glutamate-5-semialdehyde dehydrogenase